MSLDFDLNATARHLNLHVHILGKFTVEIIKPIIATDVEGTKTKDDELSLIQIYHNLKVISVLHGNVAQATKHLEGFISCYFGTHP